MFTNKRSKIVKTPLHGTYGPSNMLPAKLGPFKDFMGNVVHPMKKALAHYGG